MVNHHDAGAYRNGPINIAHGNFQGSAGINIHSSGQPYSSHEDNCKEDITADAENYFQQKSAFSTFQFVG